MHWQSETMLRGKSMESVSGQVSLLSRLLRTGIHHVARNDTSTVVVADRNTYVSGDGGLKLLGQLKGSRPLVLCESDGAFYYGEYRSNPERSAVQIWCWRPGDRDWSSVWCFVGVRHVHGVFHDPHSESIWVTTGDADSEAGIWRTDDGFKSVKRIIGGSQQVRAIQLLFTSQHIYFGSDAPDERNFIYRMDRHGQNLEKLSEVGGPVFFGCEAGGSLFFSTSVEPSKVNTRFYSEVWRSDDGLRWYRFLEFKKDFWPMGYFQYGQVFFPSGPGDGTHLYCSPFATVGHGNTVVVDVGHTANRFLGDPFR